MVKAAVRSSINEQTSVDSLHQTSGYRSDVSYDAGCQGRATLSVGEYLLKFRKNILVCAAYRRFGQRRTAYTTVVQ
jgi:hypothetical protein